MKSILQRLNLSQRIFLLFTLCILVPLTVMFSIWFSRLQDELERQAFQVLRFEAKTISMSILEKLQHRRDEMKYWIERNLQHLQQTGEFGETTILSDHFANVVLLDEGRSARAILPEDDAAGMRPKARRHSASHKPVLMESAREGALPRIAVAFQASETGWVIGHVDAAHLLGDASNYNLPPSTELTILGQNDALLFSTFQAEGEQARSRIMSIAPADRSGFAARVGGERYLSVSYPLFAGSLFDGDTWSIVLSRPEASIFGPLEKMQTNLLLTCLLVVLVTTLISSLSLRKNLDPMNRLVACANALGQGDLSARADVDVGVDFKKLAAAFNAMSTRIQSQIMEIQDSAARFKAIFDEAPAGIALADEEGRILKVNSAFAALLGYSPGELASRRVQEFLRSETSAVGEGDPQPGLLDLDGASSAVERRLVHRYGNLVSCLMNTSPLTPAATAQSVYLIHIQDITTLKNAQIENQRLEGQLHHAQKMEAMGTLAAGIAHDFNNILSAILGNADLAMMDAAQGSELQVHLENILQASRRAGDLTKQILSFSRSDRGELLPVQLNAVVKETVKLLRSSIPPHIAIVEAIAKQAISVRADPTQIHQVIMNLCTNAYHAMQDQDTGTITVSLTPVPHRLGGAPEPTDCLLLAIADTGHGMTPEVMQRIFEPYFTTKEKGKGTGLGLSIVHNLVKEHGGDIEVESRPGRGSTFRIHLPVLEQAPEPIRAAPQASSRGSESILIVDDEKTVATVWQELLSRKGYDVVSKNHPFDALHEFKKDPQRFSLVISDLAMPDMTGDRLCQELYRINPRVPVIICTGYFEEMRSKSLCESVKQHLLKPVSLETLSETIRNVIDGAAGATAVDGSDERPARFTHGPPSDEGAVQQASRGVLPAIS